MNELLEHFKEIVPTLKQSHKKQIMISSFFNDYGEPHPLIKSIMLETKNLTETFKSLFPYAVEYRTHCSKTNAVEIVDAKNLWMIFHSDVLFMDKKDADIFETLLKLLK